MLASYLAATASLSLSLFLWGKKTKWADGWGREGECKSMNVNLFHVAEEEREEMENRAVHASRGRLAQKGGAGSVSRRHNWRQGNNISCEESRS